MLSYNKVNASHVSGGDITYICIGPNQFEITFTMYRDCSGITVPTTIPVTFTNTCGLTNPAIVNLTLRDPVTGAVCTTPCATEVSQLCPSQIPNSTCNGGSLPGMQEYIYKGTVTFPGQCNSWTIAHQGNARNNSVNVTSSSGQNYYFEAVLRTLNAPCNNSPTFSAQPIPYLCAGNPVSYNLATIEPDGDSLYFSLIAAKNGPGSPVPYNAGYSGTAPLPGITIDPNTGQLNFTPTTIGNFIVVVQVEEFDAAGLSLGTVYRDFQFVIQSCSNTPPDPSSGTIQSFSGTALQTGPYSIQMCEGQNFSFNTVYTDPDPLDNLTFVTNINSVLTGSTYTNTTGGNPLNASFSWTAPAGSGGQTLSFVVTIGDGACPIPGINTFTYTVNIITSTTAGPNRYYCPAGGPIQLNAAGGTTFNWSPGTGLSCTSCSNPLASPTTTTTYTVTSNLATGCINTATVTVFVVPNFNLTVTNDTTICRNNDAFLYANAGPSTYAPFTYSWTPSYALSSTNTATTYASPQYTNTYYVSVTSNTGCRIKDSVVVTVSGDAPIIYTSTDENDVCPGTQVQLAANFMQPCGIVTYPCTGPTTTVQVGNGMYADAYTTTPFYGGTFSASKHQYIYTAAEIATILGASGGGKNISQLSFNLSGVPSVTPLPLPPVPPTAFINIRIGCTTQGEFTTYNAPFVTGLIPVKTNYLFSPVNGWNTIVLDDVYRWDGTSDIVVEVCTNVGFSASIPAIYTSTFPKYYTLYKNSPASDTSSLKGCNAVMGNRSSSRTDIRFSMCDAVPTAGYSFLWTPSTGLSSTTIPNPLATINNDITYQVEVTNLANPQCKGIETITVNIDSTNYVTAVPDTMVCPGATVQLNAILTGPPPSSSIPCGTNGTNCSGTPYLATVGTGTGFNTSTSYPAPYGNWYWGAKHQILYTAADLMASGMQSGTISEIAFNVAALNSGTLNYQNVQISMKCTSLSSLTTWQTGLSSVYSNPSYTVAMGWNTHVLTNTFDWDGISNIIVEFCFNNSSYVQNISTFWTTTPYTSVIRYVADNSTVCGSTAYATPSNTRPNTRFKTCDAPPVVLAYSWAPAAAVSNPTIANPTALINANTTFTVTVTGTNCTVSDSVTVLIGSTTPTITASGPLTFCVGDSVTLTSSSAFGNTWSTGATTQSITVSTAGNYSVTNSCGATSASITVTVNPIPTVTSASTSMCLGTSASLTATPSSSGGTYLWTPGAATTQTISVAPSSTTTYTVSYTLNGCSSTGTATVTVNALPTATMSGGGNICAGATTTVDINFTGTAPWTFTYSDGSVSNTISGVLTSPYVITTGTAGNYSLSSVSDNTCNGTVSGSAIVSVQPNIVISGITSSCNGAGTDYTVSFTITGGDPTSYTVTGGTGTITSSPPYVFTSDPIVASSPNYSFSVTDANNCSPQSVTGTQNCGCSATAVISGGGTVCAGSTTTINVTLTGTSPWTFSYTDGTTTTPVSGVTSSPYIITTGTAGTYSLLSFSDANCAGSSSGSATVIVNSNPTVTVNAATICNGSSASLTATPSTSGGTYLWSPGSATTQTISVAPSSTTTYTVSYTLNGCSGTNTNTVTVNSIPTVTSNNAVMCSGSSTTLTATPSTTGGTYSWSPGAGTTQTISVAPVSSTTYTVSYTLSGCSSTGTGTVTVDPTPIVSVNSPTICTGQTATLTASGATFYAWSNGATVNPITVSPTSTTSYTVTGTTSSCTGTAVATVTVTPLPTVTVNSPTMCAGSSATLIATPSTSGGTYGWAPTGGTTQNISVSPTSNTTYTVTYSLSGCASTGTGTVTVNPLPVMDPVADISACVNATIPASVFNTTPSGSSYSWTNSNTLIGLVSSGGGNVPSFTGTNATPTPMASTITVTPVLAGCTGATESYTITINPDPTAFVSGGGTICNGDSVVINISLTGASPFNLTYSNGSTTSSVAGVTSPSYSFSSNDTGSYTVIMISDANCNGTASGSANVNNYPPVLVALSGPTSACPGTPITLTALASGGNSGPYAYSWNPVAGSSNSITTTPSVSTSYIVTADDGCSGSASDTMQVTLLEEPVVSFSSDLTSGCAPLCINLSDASSLQGGTITSWAWSLGNSVTSAQQFPFICYDTPGQYSISLTVTGSNGCTASLTNTNMINVSGFPDASFISPSTISVLEPEIHFTNTSTDAVSWSWNFGDPASNSNTSNLENPTHIFSGPGTYCVTLTVVNSSGCSDVTEFCVVVEQEFTFYVPNAFSPNGDGHNNEFFGKGENIVEFEMSIYDRWGNLIFYSDDINEHWNGSVNNKGETCQVDVYVYKINLREGTNRNQHSYMGTVTIVK